MSVVRKAHKGVAASFHPDKAHFNFGGNQTTANFVSGLTTEALERFVQYWRAPECAIEDHGVDGGLLKPLTSSETMRLHGLPHYKGGADCVCTFEEALKKTSMDALTPAPWQRQTSSLQELAEQCPPCTVPKVLADLRQNLHPSRIPPLGLARYWDHRGESGAWAYVKSFGNPAQYPGFRWLKWLPKNVREKYYDTMANLDPLTWDQAKEEEAKSAGWAVSSDFMFVPVCRESEERKEEMEFQAWLQAKYKAEARDKAW